MRRVTRAVVLTLFGLLQACANNTQLYTAQHTVVGVDASVSADMTKGHLLIGYDRNFVTITPRGVSGTQAPDGTVRPAEEVMSALACSQLVVDGIFLTAYRERLATGNAAITFLDSADERQLSEWRKCDVEEGQ